MGSEFNIGYIANYISIKNIFCWKSNKNRKIEYLHDYSLFSITVKIVTRENNPVRHLFASEIKKMINFVNNNHNCFHKWSDIMYDKFIWS